MIRIHSDLPLAFVIQLDEDRAVQVPCPPLEQPSTGSVFIELPFEVDEAGPRIGFLGPGYQDPRAGKLAGQRRGERCCGKEGEKEGEGRGRRSRRRRHRGEKRKGLVQDRGRSRSQRFAM